MKQFLFLMALSFLCMGPLMGQDDEREDADKVAEAVKDLKEDNRSFPEFIPPVYILEEIEGELSTQGSQPGISLLIPDANVKDVEKAWKKLMKTHKAKVKYSRGEMAATGATMASLSPNEIDVYSSFLAKNGGVQVDAFYDLGDDFVNGIDFPSEFSSAQSMMKSFGEDFTKMKIEEELEGAQKDLKKLENTFKKLVNENESLHKDIERYKDAIKKAEEDIVTNEKNQEANRENTDMQKKVVDYVRDKLSKLR